MSRKKRRAPSRLAMMKEAQEAIAMVAKRRPALKKAQRILQKLQKEEMRRAVEIKKHYKNFEIPSLRNYYGKIMSAPVASSLSRNELMTELVFAKNFFNQKTSSLYGSAKYIRNLKENFVPTWDFRNPQSRLEFAEITRLIGNLRETPVWESLASTPKYQIVSILSREYHSKGGLTLKEALNIANQEYFKQVNMFSK